MKKGVKILISLVFTLVVLACCNVAKVNATDASYRTHVQDYGWQGAVSNGEISGTSGESKRLEAIEINLSDCSNDEISYRTHVQDYGWQDWKHNGEIAGTSGESKRLEAIEIKLAGEMAKKYNIVYRVHVQNIGWQDWKQNGELAGTSGQSLRLEAIQIMLVNRGMLEYQTHVENDGWQRYVEDGKISGTSGRSLRLEAIRVRLNTDLDGSIVYQTHIQNIGWQAEKSDNELAGTSGQSLRLEAIKVRLTGEIADKYDVYYRVHVQNIGWQDWKHNGELAGTSGQSLRLEAIEMVLCEKYTISYDLNDTEQSPASVNGINPVYYTEKTGDIKLINPTRTGYTFVGWQDGENILNDDTIKCSDKENKAIKALWVPNNYTVNFDANGGNIEKDEDKSKIVTYDSKYGELPTPTRKGYIFKGWVIAKPNDMDAVQMTDDENANQEKLTQQYELLSADNRVDENDTVRITDTQTVYAQWQLTRYTITYSGMNNATQNKDNPKTYTMLDADISINAPSKNGFIFDGWTGTNLQNTQQNIYIASGSIGDRNYTANWTAIEYTISYNLNGTSEAPAYIEGTNPTTYTADTETFTLINPIRSSDYVFIGWTGTDLNEPTMQVSIPTNKLGNKEYTANWACKNYYVRYQYKTSTETEEWTYDQNRTITKWPTEKRGYTVDAWENANNNKEIYWVNEEYKNLTTTKAIDLSAHEQLNHYSITYDFNDDTNKPASLPNNSTNPSNYTVLDTNIHLVNPIREGYTFVGWKEVIYVQNYNYYNTLFNQYYAITDTVNNNEANNNIQFNPSNVYCKLGNRHYKAIWTPNTYNISYDLKGGTVSTPNPTSFTVQTPNITLTNPTRAHYVFTGWIGTDLAEPTKNVTISTLNVGDKSYTATWTPVVYTISYNLAGGAVAENANPTTYTIESNGVTLTNPTRTGYNFTGWVGTGLTEPTINVTIPPLQLENKSYTATWTPIVYSIGCDLGGGSVATSNPTAYTIESNNITLTNPTKDGYTFWGWTGTGLTGETLNVSIPKGSIGDRSYNAVFRETWIMDGTYPTWLVKYNGLDSTVNLITTKGINHIGSGAFTSNNMETLDLGTIVQVSLGKDAVNYNSNPKLTTIYATSNTNDLVKQTNVTYGWKDVLGIANVDGVVENISANGKTITYTFNDTNRVITIIITD